MTILGWGLPALVVAVAALASACGDEPGNGVGGDAVFFPTHDSAEAPDELISGTPVVRQGCVILEVEGARHGLLPVWPEGFTLVDDAIEDSNGDIVGHLGETLQLGGGSIADKTFMDLTGTPIPEECGDVSPYIIGEAFKRATTG